MRGSRLDPEPAASLLHSHSRTFPVVVSLYVWSPWPYKKELLAQRETLGRSLGKGLAWELESSQTFSLVAGDRPDITLVSQCPGAEMSIYLPR